MFSSIIVNQYIFMFVLILGILAMILEVFIPSFGLVGITGLYLIFNAIVAVNQIQNPYTYIFLSIIIGLILGVIIIKLFMSRRSSSKLVLNTKLVVNTVDDKTHTRELVIVGLEGIVVKPLRPSGLALINGDNYDVISYGEFIAKGDIIVVDKIEGNKIYCRRKI